MSGTHEHGANTASETDLLSTAPGVGITSKIQLKRVRSWGKSSIPDMPSGTSPYVSIFATPQTFDSSSIDVDSYDGLLYVEVLGKGVEGPGSILCTWSNRDIYAVALPRFLAALGLSRSSALFEGFHIGICRPGKKWWQHLTPVNIWALIASTALLLTNLGVVDKAQENILAIPHWSISTPKEPVDVTEGGEVKIDFTLRNGSRSPCTFEGLSVTAEPDKAVSFSSPLDPGSNVKADGTYVWTVVGNMNSINLRKITVTGKMTTTALFRLKSDFIHVVNVNVWPSEPLQGKSRIQAITPDGKLCYADIELRSGVAYSGASGWATINSPAGRDLTKDSVDLYRDVNFYSVDFKVGKPQILQPAQGPGQNASAVPTMTWTTPKISAMLTQHMIFILEAQRRKEPADWNKILSHITCTFTPVRE